MSGNFDYMGRSNPYSDLDQMSRVGRYGGRNHVCSISWVLVKGCGTVDVVRGVSLPTPIDLTRRLTTLVPYNQRLYRPTAYIISAYNTGHTRDYIGR